MLLCARIRALMPDQENQKIMKTIAKRLIPFRLFCVNKDKFIMGWTQEGKRPKPINTPGSISCGISVIVSGEQRTAKPKQVQDSGHTYLVMSTLYS